VFAGKKSAQIREILISESAWEEMTCLFAPSLEWEDFVHTLSFTRTFLTLSDAKLEEDYRKKAEQFKDDMLVSIKVS